MQQEPKKIIIHSGGAIGADYEWAKNAFEKERSYATYSDSQ